MSHEDRTDEQINAIPEHLPKQSAKGWGLFGHRSFRLLLIGETTSKLGNSVTSVLLPIVALEVLDASPFTVAVLTAAPWLPWLLIGLLAGAWVDRMPRRPVMLACNGVSAALLASVPAAWWSGVLSVVQLIAVALLTGTASVFFSTAYTAYLPSVVAVDELADGNAKLQAGDQAARLTGPSLGGFLAQTLGSAQSLLFDVFTFVASSACLLSIRAVEKRPTVSRGPLRREIAEGLRFVVRDPYVRTLTAFGAAANLALAGYQAVQVVFLVRTLDVAVGPAGMLISCGGIGGMLGGLAAGRLARRLGTARTLVVAQLLAAPLGLLVPLARPGFLITLFIAGSALMMAGIVVCNVIIVTFRQSYCPGDMLGRITATALLLNYATIPFGALVGGALSSLLDPRLAIGVMTTALVAAGGFLLTPSLRRLRDLPAAPPHS